MCHVCEVFIISPQLRGFEDVQSSKQKELDLLKANLEAMENIVKKQFKSLSIQLAEAQEEIAVKVAQVKQYQKQVEAYKQQLEQVHNGDILCTCKNDHMVINYASGR